MKKIVLVIVLCVVSVGVFAQTKGKKRTTRTRPKTSASKVAQKPAVTAPDNTTMATNSPVMSDTSKKAVPAKPFDRPLDGYYKKTNIMSAKVTAYPSLRESDVAFQKRVWREIDLREKMNQYLGSPKARLIDVLMTAIENGELTAYDATSTKDDPGGDAFSKPLTVAQAKGKLGGDSVAVDKFDKKTGDKIGSVMQAGEFVADSIIKFRIKEDWIFDRQRSIFEPRIVGIAPMIKPKAAGVDLDYQPAFWIYFPEARPILAVKEAVSRNNDATGLSFDDCFMKRLFTSYIVKESNDKDERIKDYAQGIDKLYESERIKKSLMDWELNLWSY